MGNDRLRQAAAAAFCLALAAMLAAPASAHDVACESRLRGAPVETAPLPDGWQWDFFTLERYGAPSFQAAIDAEGFTVSLELACVSDPEGLFVRLEDLREVAGNSKLGVEPVGDQSMAAREFEDFPTIRWRHDDIVGTLRAFDDVDFGAMEDLAQAVDGLLP